MEKLLCRFVVAVVVVLVTSVTLSAQYPDTVKIMTYNINAEGHGSGSYSDIATVIKAIDPTINGIQKLDSCNSRNSQYVLKYLGEQSSMQYTFGATITNFKGSAGSYGIGFLSKEAPLTTRKLAILSANPSSYEDRAALEIGITMAGEPVRVIVTHLDYSSNAANRTAQIQKIIPWIDSVGKTDPVVIMADFNAQPTESSMKLFEQDGFVYVKGKNNKIMDTTNGINHILYRPENRWTIVDVGNPVYSASNRNPLWALMSLKDPVESKMHFADGRSFTGLKLVFSDNVLRYYLPNNAIVSVSIFCTMGRMVKKILSERQQDAGNHSICFNANGLSKGVYYVTFSINNQKFVKKLTFLR